MMKMDDFLFTVNGPEEMADEEANDNIFEQVSELFFDIRDALEVKLKEIDSRLELKGPRQAGVK